ncbi:RNase A-like domain-containing protein [Streptomyces sp. NPDC058409]|uniref:RNase A-like domain-containing protein n=1 Tax=Streptomyces sp. NPDC058409 TaxID=3346484 RepID=UPI00365540D6
MLVHNCTNIVGDEGIEGTHTINDHVKPDDATMANMAKDKGAATKWTDQATAVGAIDRARANWIKQPGNAQKLESWRIKQAQRVGKGTSFGPREDLLTIRVPVGGFGASLGRKWVKNGPQGAAVGNFVHIELKFAKGHTKPRTWVVYTAYSPGRRRDRRRRRQQGNAQGLATEALPPDVLATVLKAANTSHRDVRVLAALLEREEDERRRLLESLGYDPDAD